MLIVDIGGGTSDFSLVRLAPERREVADRHGDILATGGVHIGGTDFDKQLSIQGVMPLFGYGSRMKSDAFMPTSYHLNLATWHTINAVYAQKSQLALQNIEVQSLRNKTNRLEELFVSLVEKNLSKVAV